MSAEPLKLKTIRSEAHYRGFYRDVAFDLLSQPIPLYRSLLKNLSQFSVNFQNFRVETPNLPESHISVGLPELNTTIRVRLDRFDMDCLRLHEVGLETASRILCAIWASIHGSNESVQLSNHFVDLGIFTEIQGLSCSALLARYIKTPAALGVVDNAVGFYSRPVEKDEQWTNVVLERVFRQDSQVWVKITTGLSAAQIAVDQLAHHVNSSVSRTLSNLGLILDEESQK